MKTTIEISDALLERARQLAQSEGRSVRSLVEEGLTKVLDEHHSRPRFVLRDASVDGDGLRPEAAGLSFQEILELSYEGRGA